MRDYQVLEEENQITCSSSLGCCYSRPAPCSLEKKISKMPIGHTRDRCKLRRHKLRKKTIRLGTLNVQGMRNKTGEIIKGLEELKQDITILTETKKKEIGKKYYNPNYNFIVESQQKKKQT
jgi:hypothetical protein